jgi:hypothetical protein
MRLGLAADALDGGDVGPMAGAEKHGAGGDRSVDELLLRRIPRGHDDIAVSGVTIGTIVLCSLQAGNVSYEGDERVRKARPRGIHKFTIDEDGW